MNNIYTFIFPVAIYNSLMVSKCQSQSVKVKTYTSQPDVCIFKFDTLTLTPKAWPFFALKNAICPICFCPICPVEVYWFCNALKNNRLQVLRIITGQIGQKQIGQIHLQYLEVIDYQLFVVNMVEKWGFDGCF